MTDDELPLGAELAREARRAIELVRAAGAEVVRMRQSTLTVEMKPGDEPVTAADRKASEMIVAGLGETFPDDPVITEEAPADSAALAKARRMWLVDPIDGTKDFIRGSDGFSVMIGLLVEGVPALGVVYQPTIDRVFFATPDGGAFALANGTLTPLKVSDVASAGEARLVASASHRSDEMDRVKQELGIDNELNIGSVGVKLCLISLGSRDLYVNPAAKTKAWDSCAPEAILTRAGGKLTDLHGGPLDYRGELAHRRGLVASNGRIHDEVIAKLAPMFHGRFGGPGA